MEWENREEKKQINKRDELKLIRLSKLDMNKLGN